MKQSFDKIMVLVTIIIMDLLSGMEFDLFVPSFPELQSQFNLTPFWVEALLSVNFAGYCVSLFFVGGLADRYGRKPIILIGLITFVIGSILCLWTPSYIFLLAGRFLQGVGIAAPAILSFLIIADSYPINKQQYLLAMLNGLMNASMAAAPVVGSYVTLYFHWQGNFTVLLFLGLMVLVMTVLYIPTSKLPHITTNKSIPKAPEHLVDTAHHAQPVHKESVLLGGYIPIFKSKPMMLVTVLFLFMFVPYWIFVGMSPLLYMEDLGVSLSHFGYYQGSLALVFGFGSILYGLIISRYSYNQKKMLYLSSLFLIAGLIVIGLASISGTTNPLLITLAFIPFIIGQIIPTTILYPLCLSFMPQAKGRFTAITQGGRLVLSSLGLQLAAICYVGSFRNIGIIIIGFIIIAVIALFYVIKNRELMQFSMEEPGK